MNTGFSFLTTQPNAVFCFSHIKKEYLRWKTAQVPPIFRLHSFLSRVHADLALVTTLALDSHLAGDLCEKGIVLALANVMTRMEVRAALTDQDAACGHQSACMLLHAKALGLTVTTVTGGADALFMSEQL